MKKITIGAMFVLAGSILMTPAFATDVACTSPQTLSTSVADSVIGTSNGSTFNGCTSVDSNFQNFLVTSGTTTGTATFPALDTAVSPATGTGSAGIEFPSTINSGSNYTLDFATTGTVNTQGTTTDSCNATTWCVSGASGNASQSISYFAQATAGQKYSSITLADGTVQDTTLFTGDIVTVKEAFCLGATTTASCSDPNSGYLLVTYSTATTAPMTGTIQVCTPNVASACTLGTAVAGTSVSFSFAANTEVAIDDTVTVTTPAGGTRAVFIDSFDNTFDEATPEPSTFVLLGTSLVGLGFLRARRKKA